ncbi:MAG: hypothetical protein IJY22_03765 [Clostridia bacterium]|nr:hypothetical protein [Clostridia bacterium]
MKKIIIKTVCAILLMAFAVSAVACGGNTIYDDLAEEGYAVRVRFDVGEGGLVNETQNVTIVEAYNVADVVTLNGKTGIRILEPGDPARGKDGAFKVSYSDEKVLYFSPGWYTSRTETENGYVYSGRWDFEKDLLDPATLENGELVLYAAWIPSFTYEFYSQNEAGVFELIGSKRKIDLELPEWNTRKEEWRMNDLKDLSTDGKIFEAAYLDEAMTLPVTDTIDGDADYVDYAKGIAKTPVIKVYITWTEATA